MCHTNCAWYVATALVPDSLSRSYSVSGKPGLGWNWNSINCESRVVSIILAFGCVRVEDNRLHLVLLVLLLRPFPLFIFIEEIFKHQNNETEHKSNGNKHKNTTNTVQSYALVEVSFFWTRLLILLPPINSPFFKEAVIIQLKYSANAKNN